MHTLQEAFCQCGGSWNSKGGKKWVALAGFGFDSTFYWRDTCACDICVYQGKKKNKQ